LVKISLFYRREKWPLTFPNRPPFRKEGDRGNPNGITIIIEENRKNVKQYAVHFCEKTILMLFLTAPSPPFPRGNFVTVGFCVGNAPFS
jgi:hypothetical protein